MMRSRSLGRLQYGCIKGEVGVYHDYSGGVIIIAAAKSGVRACFLQKTHLNPYKIRKKGGLFLKKLAETRKIHINSLKFGAKN